jgi:hypothetical protein
MDKNDSQLIKPMRAKSGKKYGSFMASRGTYLGGLQFDRLGDCSLLADCFQEGDEQRMGTVGA